jgi:hypothetical protein
MSAYSFKVEQRQVPFQHGHTWVAIDEATNVEIALPSGGNDRLLGAYPEIVTYLSAQGVKANLIYTQSRGDHLDIDYEAETHTWTFQTAGGVVVKDIPRLVRGLGLDEQVDPQA